MRTRPRTWMLGSVLSVTAGVSGCFDDPETVDVTATSEGTGASTSGGRTGTDSGPTTGTEPGGTTSTSAASTDTRGPTGPTTSTTSTSSDGGGSGGSTTTAAQQCPESSTGFCTPDGRDAWAVFVTSQTFMGALGGPSGADQHCNNAAAAAGLPGDYMAWLSSATLDARSRVVGHQGDPYVLVDGTVVAEGFSAFDTLVGDLDHEYLSHPIDLDEHGMSPLRGTACPSLPNGTPVWTGTVAGGTWDTGATCEDWTSAETEMERAVGNATEIDSFWTFWCSSANCGETASLYCFQTGA